MSEVMEPPTKQLRVTSDLTSSLAPGGASSAASKLNRRAIQICEDLDVREQLFLYEKTRQLKAAVAAGDQRWIDYLRWNDGNASAYLIFMEASARTREQFQNAAEFHRLKVSTFMHGDSKTLEERGTITDTIKMLLSYSLGRTVFIIRSEMEGICRWLDTTLGPYAEDAGLPRPCFINAGDGRNQHPTHEFADQFSFLEMKGFSTESIHLALVGDLFHGRTAHSKVFGLQIFKKVRVDLVAPPELSLPEEYEDKMRMRGYEVRIFSSLEEYLKVPDIAEAFFFARVQDARMMDMAEEKRAKFHEAVTLKTHDLAKIPSTRFYQVMPRDLSRPLIPRECDNTIHNAWDRQMANGYYTKVVLLAMLAGVVGPDRDLQPSSSVTPSLMVCNGASESQKPDDKLQSPKLQRSPSIEKILPDGEDFVDNLEITPRPLTKHISQGIIPIVDGVVVDHIGKKLSEKEIWSLLLHVRKMMGWLGKLGAEGVYRTKIGGFKGLLSLPEVKELDRPAMRKLAALAPECTLNIVSNNKVMQKFRLHLPPRVYNFPSLICRNGPCISNPENNQSDVQPHFERHPYYRSSALPKRTKRQSQTDEFVFVCKWCDWPHYFWDIWSGLE